jgi:hypothetical protein
MKYIAEIHESGIFRQSVEFTTIEEREKWVEQFKAVKSTRWLPTDPHIYKVPYNPELQIKFIDADIQPLTEFSLEDWLTSRIVAGRLDGNPEWPIPIYSSQSGSFISGSLGSISLPPTKPGWYCMGT